MSTDNLLCFTGGSCGVVFCQQINCCVSQVVTVELCLVSTDKLLFFTGGSCGVVSCVN